MKNFKCSWHVFFFICFCSVKEGRNEISNMSSNCPCFHSMIDTKNICLALAVKAGLVPLISQQASLLFRVPNSLSVAAIFIFSRSGAKLSKQKREFLSHE